MVSIVVVICTVIFTILPVPCLAETDIRAQCPCYCDTSNRMNCANQNWKNIPSDIPSFVTVINFQINAVTDIQANAFGGLSELVLLRIDSNNLRNIQPGGFYGMPKLNELVLNRNKITNFDDTMIDHRSPLKRGISLTRNLLTRFPLNLLKKHRVSINTSHNRIKCDCYSVIPSDLKKLVFGECTTSAGLTKDINSISYEDANCSPCVQKNCGNGSCILNKDGEAFCNCFKGFVGDTCAVDLLNTIQPASSSTVEVENDRSLEIKPTATSVFPAASSSIIAVSASGVGGDVTRSTINEDWRFSRILPTRSTITSSPQAFKSPKFKSGNLSSLITRFIFRISEPSEVKSIKKKNSSLFSCHSHIVILFWL